MLPSGNGRPISGFDGCASFFLKAERACLDLAVETAGLPTESNGSTVGGDLGTLMVARDVGLGSSGPLPWLTFAPFPLKVRSHAGILVAGKLIRRIPFGRCINPACRFLFSEDVRLSSNRKERPSLVLTFEA